MDIYREQRSDSKPERTYKPQTRNLGGFRSLQKGLERSLILSGRSACTCSEGRTNQMTMIPIYGAVGEQLSPQAAARYGHP